METKKKNKLLKVALGKFSFENTQQPIGEKGDTFLTDINHNTITPSPLQDPSLSVILSHHPSPPKPLNFGLNSIGEASLFLEPSTSINLSHSKIEPVKQSSRFAKHKRTASYGGSVSRYQKIPTENLKFANFIELIFESKMNKEDVKNEIISYV